MVREIVHIQVGQCGNQVGCAFWDSVRNEHRLDIFGKYDNTGLDRDNNGNIDELEQVDVYFRGLTNKVAECRHVPRAVLVDLEPGTMDVICNLPFGSLFKPDNMVFGSNGAGNNWAKGHYTEGGELVESVMDQVRREVEECDAPQGFQIMHSLGGGTGSGLGTLLLLKIRDLYPDRITTTTSIYPSPIISDAVVEPYNAILSTHQLLENSDETFLIDNEALYDIANNVLAKSEPSYSELNDLIAQATCGITASLRFPGQLNGDLRKLGVNLVPFPRLHFFLVSQAPLSSKASSIRMNLNVKEITNQAFSKRNFYSKINPENGKYMACSLTFRGEMSSQEVDENIENLNSKNKDAFVEWIPNNIKSGIVSVPPLNSKMSCTFVANTSSLKELFQRLSTQFHKLYKRKAFLHWYKGEGMDEMEFQEADRNVADLITEYQDKQDAIVEEYAEDDF